MPTANKTTRSAKARSVNSPVAHRGDEASNPTKYGVPVVAVLGAGALAAAGFVLRGKLADGVSVATERLGTTGRQGSAKLLALVGLAPRRSLLSIAMPGLGGLAIGLAAGAALTLWLAPTRARDAVAKRIVSSPADGVGVGDARTAPAASNHGAT